MREITGVRERRGKSRIWVDGEFWAEIDTEVALERGLRKGVALGLEELDEARAAGERALAMNRALHFLGYRARSRREVRDRLRRYGYGPETVEGVVGRLVELGYLDDKEFARTATREKARRYGPRRVSADRWRRTWWTKSSRAGASWRRLDPRPLGGIIGEDPTPRRGGSTASWCAEGTP